MQPVNRSPIRPKLPSFHDFGEFRETKVRYMRVENWDARDQRPTPATRIEIKFDSEIWIDDYAGSLYLGKFFELQLNPYW